jgi:8-oxo-dGTP pyrophosphatase MutT (NUDIX family)
MHSDLRESIADNLRRFTPRESSAAAIAAAVAIVLLRDGDGLAIPIFQRPSTMARHAGQMALPGGKTHAGESPARCALRELHEELGLVAAEADILGRLDDFHTRSGFSITPVVVWSGFGVTDIRPSPQEVHRLFVVRTTHLREAVAGAGAGVSEAFSLRLNSVNVYAPTAAILYQFSEVALDGRQVRVHDFYQPPFTHR